MAERIRVNVSKAKAGAMGRAGLGAINAPGKKMPRTTPFREMGVGGTAVFGGYVQRKDKAASWYGKERYTISSEILSNVSIVAASVRYFLNLISHPQWAVVPASDKEEDKQYAEFVEDVIHDMVSPFHSSIRRAATFQFHGFGIQEWTGKRRPDGRSGFLDLESRMQHTIERWEMDSEGSGRVDGVWQRSPQTNNLWGIPRSKMVYLVDDTFTDSPEGFGIFRNLLEPYNRLKQFLTLEARTFERDLRGIPIGRMPIAKLREQVAAGNITEAKAKELIQAMTDFVSLQVKDSTTGIVMDSMPYESEAQDGMKVSTVYQYGMELLQGTANGLPELTHAIDRLQREMARIIGTEHLMMGDAGGNRALATDKSRNMYLTANSVLNTISASYDRDLIAPLWIMNGFPEESKPWFQPEDVAFKDVQEITASLRDMATAGAVLSPDDPAIDDVRDLLGVSRYEGDLKDLAIEAAAAGYDMAINPPEPEPEEDPAVAERKAAMVAKLSEEYLEDLIAKAVRTTRRSAKRIRI